MDLYEVRFGVRKNGQVGEGDVGADEGGGGGGVRVEEGVGGVGNGDGVGRGRFCDARKERASVRARAPKEGRRRTNRYPS